MTSVGREPANRLAEGKMAGVASIPTESAAMTHLEYIDAALGLAYATAYSQRGVGGIGVV